MPLLLALVPVSAFRHLLDGDVGVGGVPVVSWCIRRTQRDHPASLIQVWNRSLRSDRDGAGGTAFIILSFLNFVVLAQTPLVIPGENDGFRPSRSIAG